MSKTPFLSIENLTVQYKGNDLPSVNNLSLNVNEGDIFGLLGPNGAGKSTTINTISGLIKPAKGSVIIHEIDIIHHLSAAKQMIGVVGQDIALYEKLTAFENLMFFGSLYNIPKNTLRERITTLLDRMDLMKHSQKKIKAYSGGMKRRINLLAGLLHQPQLLILDEPVAGVDVQTRNVIREFISDLRKQGTTIIYTSHLMEDAERLCDQIGIIDNGELIADGKPAELVSKYKDCNTLEDVFLKLTGKKLRE
ncbi:MAG: ABC transporter ATP-binding protein [Bacteroidales bacterium]|nr:ABC transporter ATP-binding protein [Bacteroidales bacterium]